LIFEEFRSYIKSCNYSHLCFRIGLWEVRIPTLYASNAHFSARCGPSGVYLIRYWRQCCTSLKSCLSSLFRSQVSFVVRVNDRQNGEMSKKDHWKKLSILWALDRWLPIIES
jgi:hypothetical protein